VSASPQEYFTEIGGWQNTLPETLTVEHDGKAVPIRDHPFVKETKDIDTFVKRAFDTHREVGARIPVRVTDDASKEAWRKEHLPKLYEAGLLPKPLASAAEYKIARPESMPEDIVWSEERAGRLAEIAFKHKIPPGAIPDLLALHQEALINVSQIIKSTEAEAETALRREFPSDYDQRMEQAKRLTPMIFKDQAELELYTATGLANSPFFLGPLMRLAPLAAQDTSIGTRMSTDGAMTREEVQATMADIINNPQNPRHKLYKAGDAATLEYVEKLYSKIPGAQEKIVVG